jgi:hypothetical protein
VDSCEGEGFLVDGPSGDGDIVEGVAFALDFLVGFVAFAGDENEVAWSGEFDGAADGGFAIFDNFVVGELEAGFHIGEDLAGVFGAGVVGSEDDVVGEGFSGASHEGAFGFIAVAAAAEDAEEACGLEFAEGFEGVFDGVGGVSVVNEDLEVAFGRDALEASGDLGGAGEGGDEAADFATEGGRGGEGGEGIVDVEVTDEGETDEVIATTGGEGEGGAGGGELDFGGAEVSAGGEAGGEGRGGWGEAIEEAAPETVIKVDDGATGAAGAEAEFLEKEGFGGEIVLHVAVVIEVVLGEVGEDGGVEFDGIDAVLDQGVAGDFHGAGFGSGGEHAGEEFLGFEGVWGGAGGGEFFASEGVMDGADEAAGFVQFIEEVFDEVGGGGFAVGAGDADNFEMTGGVLVKAGSGGGEEGAGIIHDEAGDLECGEGVFGHDGTGSAGDGIRNKRGAVLSGAGEGEEEGAGSNAAGVQGEGVDFDAGCGGWQRLGEGR